MGIYDTNFDGPNHISKILPAALKLIEQESGVEITAEGIEDIKKPQQGQFDLGFTGETPGAFSNTTEQPARRKPVKPAKHR